MPIVIKSNKVTRSVNKPRRRRAPRREYEESSRYEEDDDESYSPRPRRYSEVQSQEEVIPDEVTRDVISEDNKVEATSPAQEVVIPEAESNDGLVEKYGMKFNFDAPVDEKLEGANYPKTP